MWVCKINEYSSYVKWFDYIIIIDTCITIDYIHNSVHVSKYVYTSIIYACKPVTNYVHTKLIITNNNIIIKSNILWKHDCMYDIPII